MKKILLIIAVLCLSFLVTSCQKGPKALKVGKQAPDFSLTDLTGITWALSELKGQVVFVNFWSTTCAPCVEEMPSMQRLYSQLPRDKFKMLAILVNDDPFNAVRFALKYGITMPILNDKDSTVGLKYGLTGVPETFIVDKQGILREKFIGSAQWDSPQYVRMLMKYINTD